jgi:hypothetical protein
MKNCKKCGGTMKSGGTVKKMAKGGMATTVLGPPKKPFAAGIPFFTGAGQTGPESMKKGGAVKKAKLAALAAPKNKITRADIIVGAKKRMAKKK